ncbi:MAG: sugar phosphate nucleotidyltransferase [Calditrichaceae bacterium]
MKNLQKVSKAVIIAAGTGSRIVENTNGMPKTLLPFHKKTILSTILNRFKNSGINDFIIVVGYNSELIKQYLIDNNYLGLNISFVMNDEWRRGNGISVLRSEEATKGESFILSMSDHIVSESAIKRLISSENNSNLLLVDQKINEIFDIDDATKVELTDDRIINIGKEIPVYNGIDCGVFRLKNNFYDAMRQQLKKGKESISAAIEVLIKKQDMYAVFTKEEDYWLDVDTPEAYKHGLENLANE